MPMNIITQKEKIVCPVCSSPNVVFENSKVRNEKIFTYYRCDENHIFFYHVFQRSDIERVLRSYEDTMSSTITANKMKKIGMNIDRRGVRKIYTKYHYDWNAGTGIFAKENKNGSTT